MGGNCANWAGAHLSSLGCILYGVLETEAAFNIPPTNGGVFFAGTYIYGSSNGLDPSWNVRSPACGSRAQHQSSAAAPAESHRGTLSSPQEVDQTVIYGAADLEFHGSLFISNPSTSTCATCTASNAHEDKDVFEATSTQCNSYMPPKGTPGNMKGLYAPFNCPGFSTMFASSFHTYKIVWTPAWIAWVIDTTVYRNSSSSPWRPVTMRPLLRTNVGTAASVQSLPDVRCDPPPTPCQPERES